MRGREVSLVKTRADAARSRCHICLRIVHIISAREVCSLPPCGGGLGRGWRQRRCVWLTPLPSPPPQGGRERTVRASRLFARNDEERLLPRPMSHRLPL